MTLPVYKYILILSFLLALINIKSIRPGYLKSFVPFLFFVVFAELASPLGMFRGQKSNHWFFNIITAIEFIFYFFIYRQALDDGKIKRYIPVVAAIYLLLCIFNFLFVQGFNHFHTVTYRLGALITIVLCCLYFRQILRSEQEIRLYALPIFWISLGLLFFYSGFFIYMSAFDYIVYKDISYNKILWRVINRSLNTLLYVCFTVAFICHKVKAKYYTS